jgi:hypothetical protein
MELDARPRLTSETIPRVGDLLRISGERHRGLAYPVTRVVLHYFEDGQPDALVYLGEAIDWD